jgi:hypothetical protein
VPSDDVDREELRRKLAQWRLMSVINGVNFVLALVMLSFFTSGTVIAALAAVGVLAAILTVNQHRRALRRR